MVLHSHHRGEHSYRSEPGPGDFGLSPDATIEATGSAVVHVHGACQRLWAFGRAKLFVHGEVQEIHVLGASEVRVFGVCRRLNVGMHGSLWIPEPADGALVIVKQRGTVYAGNGARVRAYGEARVQAPSTADVVLHWYSQWHTGEEVRGNLSTYRPGYCVVR